jgi:hypothetical protein
VVLTLVVVEEEPVLLGKMFLLLPLVVMVARV